jgi:hypothetical protein
MPPRIAIRSGTRYSKSDWYRLSLDGIPPPLPVLSVTALPMGGFAR